VNDAGGSGIESITAWQCLRAGYALRTIVREGVVGELYEQTAWTDSSAYEIFMGRWSELLAPPFLAVASIPTGSRVLDAGCGTGVLSKALAEAGHTVVGIDASEPYLQGARDRRSHPNITYEHGDIFHIRFEDRSFDAVVSTLVLDALPDAAPAVAEMRRVTRPGGVVASGLTDLWISPYDSMLWDTAAVLDAGMSEQRDFMKARPISAANGLAALWRKTGLVEVTEVPVVTDCVYSSFADYWATFAGGQGAIAARFMELSDHVRGEIERHVRAGYLAGMLDGPRCIPKVTRVVRGIVPG
jgi:SAM-dependent methyltransferase